jgi:hypothetical protein
MGRDEIEEKGTERIERGGEQQAEGTEREVDTRERKEAPYPAPTCTAVNPEAHEPMRFDWATDVDESMSPVPVIFPDRAPTECGTSNPPLATTDNPVPAKLDKPAPSSPGNPVIPPQPIHVVPKPSANGDRGLHAPTPLIIHGPRDLSALCSGMKNPWGSSQRRHDHSYPPRDFSVLHLGSSNPWGSLRHRRRRSYPPHLPHAHSHPESLQYAYLNPSHSDRPPCKPQSQSHSQSPPHPPHPLPSSVHITQTIQHPHGISPTKPKITKIIPTTTTKILQNIHTARCTCGNIIPAYSSGRRSWRPMDTRDRRFRRRFRSLWDRERGRSHVWGGHL